MTLTASMIVRDFDDVFSRIEKMFYVPKNPYPPLNISKYTENGKANVLIEMALAGFYKNEITVGIVKERVFACDVGSWVDVHKLAIKAEKDTKEDAEYFVRKLAQRNVKWSRILQQNSKVKEVKFKQGILRIVIELDDSEETQEPVVEYLKIK